MRQKDERTKINGHEKLRLKDERSKNLMARNVSYSIVPYLISNVRVTNEIRTATKNGRKTHGLIVEPKDGVQLKYSKNKINIGNMSRL